MINFLFLIKPIIDILWEYQFLDLLLLLIIIIYFIPRFYKLKFGYESIFLSIFSLLLMRSYTADINYSSTIVLIKVFSAILIFYIAKFNSDIDQTFNYMKISYLVPIFVIIMYIVSGTGYQYWGNVLTFSGPYYYKTDLAIAVVFSVIFFRGTLFFTVSRLVKILVSAYIFLLAPYIIFLTNSRMLLIVYGIIILILIYEQFGYKKIKIPKVVTLFLVSISLLTLMLIFQDYNSLNENSNKLSISFDFTEANTQGRSGIWESVISNFYSGSGYNILFGYYINSDIDFNTFLNNDAHNVYLKLLVNTGFVGLSFYLMFISYNLFIINKNLKKYKSNKFVRYRLMTILLIFLTFIICGFTQSNIIFTQSSWYAFYLTGLLYNKNIISSINVRK